MVSTLFSTFYLFLSSTLLLFAFHQSFKDEKHLLLPWFLIGACYNFFSLLFFFDFLPGNFSVSLKIQYIILSVFILICSAIAGVSFLIIPLLLRQEKYLYKLKKLLLPFLILLSFFLEDCIRSLFFSLFYLGKESSFGLRLFLGSLGENLVQTPFVIFAYKGGIYFLTAIFGYLLFIFYSIISKKLSLKINIFHLLFFFTVFILLEKRVLMPLQHLSLGILQTEFQDIKEGHAKEDLQERLFHLENALQKEKRDDILIFPESTFYLVSKETSTTTLSLKASYLLDSQTLHKKDRDFAHSVFYDTKNNIQEIRGKDDLMIFSEYSSYVMDILMQMMVNEDTFLTYKKETATEKSNSFHTFYIEDKGIRFAALLCSEATSFIPQFFFEKEKPDFYILQSNLNIMKKRPLGLREYEIYTKLLAVTTGKTVVSVANNAPFLLFDGKGNLVEKERAGTFYKQIKL